MTTEPTVERPDPEILLEFEARLDNEKSELRRQIWQLQGEQRTYEERLTQLLRIIENLSIDARYRRE